MRRGEAVEGRTIPMASSATKMGVAVTAEARKKAMEESPKRSASIRGDEYPRCREMKSVIGVRRSPEVPAAAITDLSKGVPLNWRTRIIKMKTL